MLMYIRKKKKAYAATTVYMPLSSNLLDVNGHTVNAYGSPAIVSVGGSNAVQFGDGKALFVPILPQIGSQNFTLSFYMYRAGGASYDHAVALGNYVGGGMVGIYINGVSGTMSYMASQNTSTVVSYIAFASGAAYTSLTNRWVKVEMKRVGSSIEIVTDGTSRGLFSFVPSATFVYGDRGNSGGLMVGGLDNSSSAFTPHYDSSANLYIREVMFVYN